MFVADLRPAHAAHMVVGGWSIFRQHIVVEGCAWSICASPRAQNSHGHVTCDIMRFFKGKIYLGKTRTLIHSRCFARICGGELHIDITRTITYGWLKEPRSGYHVGQAAPWPFKTSSVWPQCFDKIFAFVCSSCPYFPFIVLFVFLFLQFVCFFLHISLVSHVFLCFFKCSVFVFFSFFFWLCCVSVFCYFCFVQFVFAFPCLSVSLVFHCFSFVVLISAETKNIQTCSTQQTVD